MGLGISVIIESENRIKLRRWGIRVALLDYKVSNGFNEFEMYYHLEIKIHTIRLRVDPIF